MRAAATLLAALATSLCALTAFSQRFEAREGARLTIVEQADFVLDEGFAAPPDSAAWTTVKLPDDWSRSRPGTKGVGWYRIVLPVSAPRRLAYNIHLPRNSANHIGFWANGHLFGGTAGSPSPAARLIQEPVQNAIAPALLRPGENRLYLRVVADADFRQGLTRVTMGDPGDVRQVQLQRLRLQVLPFRVFGFVALLAGLAALAIWLRRRDDPTLFWFALASSFAGLPALVESSGAMRQPGAFSEALLLLLTQAFAPALAAASLRAAHIRAPVFESLLWAGLLAGAAAPFVLGVGAYPRLSGPMTVIFFAALTVTLVLLVLRSTRDNRLPAITLGISHLAAIAFGVHDWAQWEGWVDFDRAPLFQFAPPVLMLALGVLLIARHFKALDELAALNLQLESRVTERGAEIERTYAQLRELEREQATVRERQRIMADMHDGLGASLVGLLSLVQGGKADLKTVEQRVHDALQELRLAVDSLDTPDGDVATALGTVRHRLRDPLAAAGIEFQWNVGEIPRLEEFTASRILNLQRILLEAITNAVRHSGAHRIAVAANAGHAGELEFSVEDDGRGIDAAARGNGRGLMTMQRRAAALGGRLQVGPRAGGGTRVELSLRSPPPHPPAS